MRRERESRVEVEREGDHFRLDQMRRGRERVCAIPLALISAFGFNG